MNMITYRGKKTDEKIIRLLKEKIRLIHNSSLYKRNNRDPMVDHYSKTTKYTISESPFIQRQTISGIIFSKDGRGYHITYYEEEYEIVNKCYTLLNHIKIEYCQSYANLSRQFKGITLSRIKSMTPWTIELI